MPPYPGGSLPPPRSAVATPIGVEHALLSYQYLDEGDLDGYASLVDSSATFGLPGQPEARGPEDVAARTLAHYGSQGTHQPVRVVTSEDVVVITGILTIPSPELGGTVKREFADFFAITEHGLLAARRRFHADPENPTPASVFHGALRAGD